jgi:GTPase
MGFSGDCSIISNSKLSWPEIINKSTKVAIFFDMAGHDKYLKTTVNGLSSSHPDLCFLIISGNKGVNDITKQHAFLCQALDIPLVTIITKVDICKQRSKVLKHTVKETKDLLQGTGFSKRVFFIKTSDDVVIASKHIYKGCIAPIFKISNVTGQGLDLIRQFINLTPKRNDTPKKHLKKDTELHVSSIFNITGVGCVVGGVLVKGKVEVGDLVTIGPTGNGEYYPTQVKSIHIKRVNVEAAEACTYVCLSLRKIKSSNIKKGYVVLSTNAEIYSVRKFKAKIRISKGHSTTISRGFEPTVYINNIKEACKIIEISEKDSFKKGDKSPQLRSGDVAIVSFNVLHRQVFIKTGETVIFCQGQLTATGRVTEIDKILIQ